MKDSKQDFDDFVFASEPPPAGGNILPSGEHMTICKTFNKEMSKGAPNAPNVDKSRQFVAEFEATEENEEQGTIRGYYTLEAHKRRDEVSAKDLQNPKFDPSKAGLSAKEWNAMDKAEKLEVAFASFKNPEGQEIAYRTDTLTRIIDPKRTKDAQGKVRSLLFHAGLEEGETLSGYENIREFMEGKEVGINVGTGLTNQKGNVMPKVLNSLPLEDVVTI